jgi:hypothetical protein
VYAHDGIVSRVAYRDGSTVTRHPYFEPFEICSERQVLLQLNPEYDNLSLPSGFITLEGLVCNSSDETVAVYTQLVSRSFSGLSSSRVSVSAHEFYASGHVGAGDLLHLRTRWRSTSTSADKWLLVTASGNVTCNSPANLTTLHRSGSVTHTQLCPETVPRSRVTTPILSLAPASTVQLFAHYGNPSLDDTWNTVIVTLGVNASTPGEYVVYTHLNEGCNSCVQSRECTSSFGALRFNVTSSDVVWTTTSIAVPSSTRDLGHTGFSSHELSLSITRQDSVGGAISVHFGDDTGVDAIQFASIKAEPVNVTTVFYKPAEDQSGIFAGNDAATAAAAAADGFIFVEYAYFLLGSAVTVASSDTVHVNLRLLGLVDGRHNISVFFVTIPANSTDPHADSCGSNRSCSDGIVHEFDVVSSEWRVFNVTVPDGTVDDWSAVKWIAFLYQTRPESRRRRDAPTGVPIYMATAGTNLITTAQPQEDNGDDDDSNASLIGAIVGGVIGSFVLLAAIVALMSARRSRSYSELGKTF